MALSRLGGLERPDLEDIQKVFLPEIYGAVGDGVNDDTTGVQLAIDAAESAGNGAVLLNGSYAMNNVTLKAGVELAMSHGSKIAHNSASGTCLTVQTNTSIVGGEIQRDSTGETYTGTLLAVSSDAVVSRAAPIYVKTSLQCLGQHQGTGLLVESDATSADAWVQWSVFDVNVTSLETGVRVYAHDGAVNNAFINGNTFYIRAQNCDNTLDLDGVIANAPIGNNTFYLTVQAASNSERAIYMRGASNNIFYCRIFDWHAVATNAQPIYAPGSSEGNYRNTFYGVDFYDFLNNTTIGDMRLQGVHNKIAQTLHGSPPFRLDSSVGNTNQLYYSNNAAHMEGHLWWDETGGKLKFSNGAAIETVTSA